MYTYTPHLFSMKHVGFSSHSRQLEARLNGYLRGEYTLRHANFFQNLFPTTRGTPKWMQNERKQLAARQFFSKSVPDNSRHAKMYAEWAKTTRGTPKWMQNEQKQLAARQIFLKSVPDNFRRTMIIRKPPLQIVSVFQFYLIIPSKVASNESCWITFVCFFYYIMCHCGTLLPKKM